MGYCGYCASISSRGFDLCVVVVVVLCSKPQGLPASAAALKRLLHFFAHSQLEIWLGLNNGGVPTDGIVARQRSCATSACYCTSIITGPSLPICCDSQDCQSSQARATWPVWEERCLAASDEGRKRAHLPVRLRLL